MSTLKPLSEKEKARLHRESCIKSLRKLCPIGSKIYTSRSENKDLWRSLRLMVIIDGKPLDISSYVAVIQNLRRAKGIGGVRTQNDGRQEIGLLGDVLYPEVSNPLNHEDF